MGSLLVASHFLCSVAPDETPCNGDGSSTPPQNPQHQQGYSTTGSISNSSKRRTSVSKQLTSDRSSEAAYDPASSHRSSVSRQIPSQDAADSAPEPSTTSSPYRATTMRSVVPPLNMAQLNIASMPGEQDGGLMTSTAHGPMSVNFSKSASVRGAHEALSRRSARLQFLQSPPEVRTEADLHFLDDAVLYSADACATLTKGARMALAKLATLASFEPGDEICAAGRDMTHVYFVLAGEATSTDPDGTFKTYDEGQSIGLLCDPPVHNPHTPRTRQALRMPRPPMSRWPSTVTSISTMDCAVVTQEQWALVRSMETYWDARQVRSFLEDLPSFGTLSQDQLLQLSRLVRTIHFPSDSVIFRQGQDSDDMFLLRTGFVRILKNMSMDQGSRTRLNKLSAESNVLASSLHVLTSPRGKVPHPLTQFKDTSPRPGGLSEEQASGARAPMQSDGSQGPDQFGTVSKPSTPIMKLPRLPGHRNSTDEGGRGRLDSPNAFGDRRGSPGPGAAEMAAGHPQRISSPSIVAPGSLEGGGGRGEDLVYQRAFSSNAPFLLDKTPQVFVEVGTICSGTIFGDVTSGRRVHRACSAVADTRVEVFQMVRSEIKARLGDALMFLWGTDSVSGKPSTDEAIRGELEKNMQWDLYKKKLMQEVFIKKQAKWPSSHSPR